MLPNSVPMAAAPPNHPEQSPQLISPSKKKRRQRKGAARQMGSAEIAEGGDPQKSTPKSHSRTLLDLSRPSEAVVERLETRGVYPLKNRSIQNPKALYFCRLCSYHCDNIERAEQHIRGNRHIMKENNRDMRDFLLFIPTPVRPHLGHLSTCLAAEARASGLSADELERRRGVFDEVKRFLEQRPGLEPDLRLQLFGSMVNGFAVPDSDVNIDVSDVQDRRQLLGRFLLKSYQAMKDFKTSSKSLVALEEHFMGAYPYFLAKDSQNVVYKFCVNNSHCFETNALIKVYCDLDERCKQLGLLFRKMAKLAHIDKQDMGTFPPLAFPILAIHFLQQQRPPVLPVLQELVEDRKIPRSAITCIKVDDVVLDYVHEPAKYWKTKNDQSVGELWLNMLRYYAVEFNYETQVISVTASGVMKKATKGWKHKRVSIEDPLFPRRDLGRSLGLNDVMDYVLLQLRTAYRYFAVPQTEQGPLFKFVKRLALDASDSGTPATAAAKRRVQLTPMFNPNGDLMRTAGKMIGELRANGLVSLPEAPNNGKQRSHALQSVLLTVANGILKSLGVTSASGIVLEFPTYSVPPELTDEFLDQECKTTVFNFLELVSSTHIRPGNWTMKAKTLRRQLRTALTRCAERCCNEQLVKMKNTKAEISIEEMARRLVVQIINSSLDTLSDELGNKLTEEQKAKLKLNSKLENPDQDSADIGSVKPAEEEKPVAMSEDEESEEEEEGKSPVDGCPMNGLPKLPAGVVSCDEPGFLNLSLYRDLEPEQLHFKFGCNGMLGDVKPPELRCSSCNRCGHLRDSCPEDEVDFRGVKLPNLSQSDMYWMTTLLQQVPVDFQENDEHRRRRRQLLNDISQTLKKSPYQDVRLEMFGSCVNGFGFSSSDVDICMSFLDAQEKPREFSDKEVRDIVVEIAKILKKGKKFFPCRAIPQAKVPIVKFTHWSTKQEGDLSLNNRLALQNSKLLLTYHNMDPRVKTLGFIVKILAKLCEIGDASRGSLSSYAYIILMLHYLQQEGVIPCLQEMYPRDKPRPVLMIEGWDAWFNDDMKFVYNHWQPRNKKSVAELWLGFLEYYTQVFDWRHSVVTIKQLQPLHRLEKLWTQSHLAIEDPFDLNHNLGCGLSKKMATYIQRVLFKTLVHFRSPLPNLSHGQIKDYLFDPKKLTGPLGPVPRDRCCKTCGVIGHIARECPTTNPRARKDNEADFLGEIEGADAEEEEEEEDADEEDFPDDVEEEEEESPSIPAKGSEAAEDGVVEPRQRGNSQSSNGTGRARASPQKGPPNTVHAQLMYPAAGSVSGAQPPPLVYVPNSPGNSGPYSISMRPIMMTVDNKDVAVPVATTPSPEMLMNMYYNFFNSGMGQGSSVPRLELEPNQQDPCIVGVGPLASAPGGPASVSQGGHWPRLGPNSPQTSQPASHQHSSPGNPFQDSHQQMQHPAPHPNQSHNNFQRQPNPDHHHQPPHRPNFHQISPMTGRAPRSPQSGPNQQSYSRALSTNFGHFSPMDAQSPHGHQNSNTYNRGMPGQPMGQHGPQHGNQYGMHHRHGFQSQPPPPPAHNQQRRPAALQQMQQHHQQYGHPGHPSNSPYKGGPKRRG